MTAKLAPHLLDYHGVTNDQLVSYRSDWVKLVDPDAVRARELQQKYGKFLLLRLYNLTGPQPGEPPMALARRHSRSYIEHPSFPYAAAVESMNEPIYGLTDSSLQYLFEYWIEFARLVKAAGMLACWGNLASGWPPGTNNEPAPYWQPYLSLPQELLDDHYLGLHEYWRGCGPGPDWGWLAGRYEKCPIRTDILITECGYNRAALDPSLGQHGWVGDRSRETYVYELETYLTRLQDDHQVIQAFVFTDDYGTNNWSSFNVASLRSEIGRLNDAVSVAPSFPSLPLPSPSPALDWSQVQLRLGSLVGAEVQLADDLDALRLAIAEMIAGR